MHVHVIVRKTPAFAAMLAAFCAAACGRAADASAPKQAADVAAPVDVRLVRVEAGSLPRVVRATGTLDSEDVVVVAADVPGKVVGVFHEVGDRVAVGEKLARIDETDFAMEVDQRRRALTETLARLALDALPEGDVDFEHLPSVERARIEADNAKAKYERMKSLHERPAPLVSVQDFTDARTAYEVAESERRLALLTARADLAAARTRRAELDVAEKRLRDTLHMVPAGERPGDDKSAESSDAYLIARRFVAAGDRVTTGSPLFRLVDPDPLRLRVQVPERRAADVKVGLDARVRTGSASQPLSGRVARIRPEIDLRTRTVEVEISVGNPDFGIQSGAFATAEIEVGMDTGLAMVPQSAVRNFAGVNKVFVVAGGKAKERIVAVGRTTQALVEITDGLRVGDEIVAEPPTELVTDAPVRVVGPAPTGQGK